MDPVTLIITALTAGVAAGASDTVTTVISDAYQGLKALISSRFSGESAEITLAEYETDPQTWQEVLIEELRASGADSDPDIITAAQRLLTLFEQSSAKKYTVDLYQAQGTQVGDHNHQVNQFTNHPPSPSR